MSIAELALNPNLSEKQFYELVSLKYKNQTKLIKTATEQLRQIEDKEIAVKYIETILPILTRGFF